MSRNNFAILCLTFLLLSACNGRIQFETIHDGKNALVAAPTTPGESVILEKQTVSYVYTVTQDTFKQDSYDVNTTAVVFQAYDVSGKTVKNLSAKDFVIKENGVEVTNFNLKSNTSRTGNDADIVFSLDITSSMDEHINKVRDAIRGFVSQLEYRDIKANLCIVTFKDQTEKICSKFVEDDPTTPDNENLVSFLDELGKIKVGGGGYIKENSLGGLISAAQDTAWHAKSQRIIIHVTDADFWVMPNDESDIEARYAPTYQEAVKSVKKSGATVFTIAPRLPGFETDFEFSDSFPKLTNGQFFELKKLQDGKITMNDIFNKISQSLTTDYEINYTSEENLGLDPKLPLKDRKIEVMVTSPLSTRISAISSSMPDGSPQYKTKFALQTTSPIKDSTIKLQINGQDMTTGYHVSHGELIFDLPPEPGSQITLTYELKNLRDNIKVLPVSMKGRGQLKKIDVWFNKILANVNDFEISKSTSDGTHILIPKDSVFSQDDPYRIRETGSLNIEIEYISEI